MKSVFLSPDSKSGARTARGSATGLCLFLLCACVWGAWSLRQAKSAPREAALLVDAGDVRALCAASGYPESAFYERARAAGAWGALLRPWSVEEASRNSLLLHFSRKDVDKMRRLGLLGEKSPLQGDSLWSQDRAFLELVARMLELRGISWRGAELAHRSGLLLSEEISESMSAGYDRAAVERVREKGLVPVFAAQDAADAQAAAGLAAGKAAGLWVSGAYLGGVAAKPLAELLAFEGRLIFADEAGNGPDRSSRRAWLESCPAALARALKAGEVRQAARTANPAAGFGPGACRRSARASDIGVLRRGIFVEGNALALLRLEPGSGVEAAFERLRPAAEFLRAEGFVEPGPARGEPRLFPAWLQGLGAALVLLLCVLGSFLSLRAGLDVMKWASRVALPQASPLFETACGLFAACAASLPFGAAAWFFFSAPSRRLGLGPARLEAAALALVFAVGWAALYPMDLRRRLPEKDRLRWAGLAALFVLAAAVLCLGAVGKKAPLSDLGLRAWGWDWLFLRWPEALLGQAALFVGLWKARAKEEGPGGPGFRPFFLLGLLALTRLIFSFSAPEPFLRLCGRGAQLSLLGLLAGLSFLALRDAFPSRPR